MLLNAANLAGLNTGFRANYNQGLGTVESMYLMIATVIASVTGENSYPILGDMPGIREFVDERHVHKLGQHDYTLKNKEFELTLGVKRKDIEDDQYGIYAPLFSMMGYEAASHADSMVFDLLAAGFVNKCYDGQNFFDPDHPGYDKDGGEISVSNMQAGSSNPWFLMDTRRPLKPLIHQNRKEFEFTAKDKLTDDNVFDKNEFKYGVYGRSNAGYAFWQTAFGSKAALSTSNFNDAIASMMGIKKLSGKPAGINPNLLICGPSNRATALEVVKAERNAAGATNINRDAVEVKVVEWLA